MTWELNFVYWFDSADVEKDVEIFLNCDNANDDDDDAVGCCSSR